MWKKIKKLTDFALVVGFLGFVFLVPVKTFRGPVKKTVQETRLTRKSLVNLTKKFEGILEKNLGGKYRFINLNGAVAKYLGMNSLNNIQKLRNGYLTGFGSVRDIDESSQKVIALNNFLVARKIPFLYLLAPGKKSFYDVQFAPGYDDDTKQNVTNMFNTLNAAGVEAINMDAWFKRNGWHMEDVFFITDHHWLPEAGLAAARCVMKLIQKNGIADYDEEKLCDENYRKDVLKKWFLGSSGKRTGRYYGGVDDITVFHPKFETDYFYAGLRSHSTSWEYRDNILDLSYVEKRDYYRKNPYAIHMVHDYPMRITINAKAQNNKRLLLMGCSFKTMPEYFFTTQFREVHTMDLRVYSDGTFAQCVEEFKPDLVIMCLNAYSIEDKKLNAFGVDEYLAALDQTDPNSPVQNLGNFELQSEEENKNKFSVVCGNLEPNQAYTLTVDRTALSGVELSFVQMTLQNLSTNKAIYNRYFESNSGARQKWIFTTPEKIEDAYGIYLYAGTKGYTAGIDVKVEGIKIRKGIFEN